MSTATAKPWSNDTNEDWAKSTWDVRLSDGSPVTTLEGLARVLGVNLKAAAESLLTLPYGRSAPDALRQEAEDVRAGKMPEKPTESLTIPGVPNIVDTSTATADVPRTGLKRGDMVTWSDGRGRVDLVVNRGMVPGVDGSPVFGGVKGVAVRVVVLEQGEDGGWKPTDVKIAKPVAAVTRVPEQPDAEGKGLVEIVAAFQGAESPDWPEWAKVNGAAVKAVHNRGRAGYPGQAVTSLSADDWALGRVKAFLDLLTLKGAPEGYVRDLDLLPPGHPARKGAVRPDVKTLDDDALRAEYDVHHDAAIALFEAHGGVPPEGTSQRKAHDAAVERAQACVEEHKARISR